MQSFLKIVEFFLQFFKLTILCFFVSLSAGILFSTLVFGPACGFILGSVCTKVYVDAVFIDTSKYEFAFSLHFLRALLEFCYFNSYMFIDPIGINKNVTTQYYTTIKTIKKEITSRNTLNISLIVRVHDML